MKSLRSAVILLAGMAALRGGEAAAQPALKPALQGLVSMGNIAFHRRDGGVPDNSLADLLARPGIFAGVVVNVTWAELEPAPGRLDAGAIDQPLAAVRAYNAKYPATPLAVHLRVWGGPNAPDWAKRLGGAPVSVLHLDMPITIGRFWTAPYRDAWRSLQERLARKYDSEPLIREVSNTSCASITDEPFLLPADPLSLQHLIEAGFDSDAERDCLAQSAKDYALWRTTRIDYYFNPFRGIVGGRPQVEPEVALAIMHQWREQLGPRG
ncbi:MAG TPA: hypothetical protein VE397_02730, partial [Stellaceae bacterium]|nr:hypothetical protein [Stellaceae bacterium]